jgi:hypothetical protein
MLVEIVWLFPEYVPRIPEPAEEVLPSFEEPGLPADCNQAGVEVRTNAYATSHGLDIACLWHTAQLVRLHPVIVVGMARTSGSLPTSNHRLDFKIDSVCEVKFYGFVDEDSVSVKEDESLCVEFCLSPRACVNLIAVGIVDVLSVELLFVEFHPEFVKGLPELWGERPCTTRIERVNR